MLSGMLALGVSALVKEGELRMQGIVDGVRPPMTSEVQTQAQTSVAKKVIKYDVSSRGAVEGNLEEFRKLVAETLEDARGWVRAGVEFEEVASGASMHVILASGEQVAAAAPGGCSATLSCRVGSLVLINDTRWMNGSDSYNALDVALTNYRQMVINHEVGHFLGHGHIEKCETNGGLAPVMLQQSTGLRGCLPNVWPLATELWYKL